MGQDCQFDSDMVSSSKLHLCRELQCPRTVPLMEKVNAIYHSSIHQQVAVGVALGFIQGSKYPLFHFLSFSEFDSKIKECEHW